MLKMPTNVWFVIRSSLAQIVCRHMKKPIQPTNEQNRPLHEPMHPDFVSRIHIDLL